MRASAAFGLVAILAAAFPPGVEAQGCTIALSRTNVLAGPEGLIFAFSDVTASAPSCTWSATTVPSWIQVTGSASAGAVVTGSERLLLTLFPNGTGAMRAATITVAGQAISVTQQATPCVTSLTPNPLTFPYPGFGDPAEQQQNVTVDAPADCHWQHGPWPLNVSPNPTLGGVGRGVVRVGFAPVGGGPLTVGIGSVPLTLVRLPAPCVFAFSPASITIGVNGGSGSVTLTGTGTDCSFTATASGAGLSITRAVSGTAPATLSYAMQPNDTESARSSYISVPNASVTVSQNGAPAQTDVSYVSFGGVSSGGTLSPLSPAEEVRLTIDEQPGSAWMVTANWPWIVVTPSTGSGPATLRVSVDPAAAASLTPSINPYMATIGITAAFAPATAVRSLSASLTVMASGVTSAPIGVFETPVNNTPNASGAIPVTGWAVDDIDLARIQIFRDPVAGEGAAEIFIGDATRVKGARPDIAARFGTPQSRRAGWGYMLLSNVLPGAGNGRFTFSAYVDDVDGHRVLLGRRIVTFDNAAAIRPFGTIDEPTQGQTVSGTILNRGWALTPAGKAIPFDGSTVKVYIDGLLLAPVSEYNRARPDVKAFFPGLANADGPEAILAIDTTLLADGVHTIAWAVTDDAGVAEGLGSRYLTVQNGAASLVDAPADTARSAGAVARMPRLQTEVWSREGVTPHRRRRGPGRVGRPLQSADHRGEPADPRPGPGGGRPPGARSRVHDLDPESETE